MKRYISLAIISFICSVSVYSWDAVGHRIVAEVAYNNLSKKARTQVDEVLGKRGMIHQSSWPDEIKSDTIYAYSHVWHYQNMRAGLSRADIADLYEHKTKEGEHAFYALDSLERVLRQNKKDAVALKFIVHIMGDIFQPMHLGHPDDKGGNKVQMRWFSNGTNLHAVWDRWLINYTQLSGEEFVALLEDVYGGQKKSLQQMSMLDCLYVTYDRQQAVYQYQEKKDNSAYHYAYRFRGDLELSLYTAGLQLAKLLNSIYK